MPRDIPIPFNVTPIRRYYVAPREVVPGHYGSSLEISIPEPDGELMLTVLDHEGRPVTDVYFDHDELFDAITRVLMAYNRIPEESKCLPHRPAANHPPVEGSHP